MATVYAAEGVVMARLDSVFDDDDGCCPHLFPRQGTGPSFKCGPACQCGQIVELLLVDAVGACADDNADDLRVGERLLVKQLQLFEGRICVRICLKISEIMLGRAVSHLMELNALVHLLTEALAGRAVRRVEGRIVAVGTSAPPHLSVAVRAGEARIEDDLLQTLPVLALEIPYKRIISLSLRESVFFKIM